MSAIVIAQRLADVGAVLGGSFDQDRAGVSLRTLSSARERDASLSILAAVLHKPEFPLAAIPRERARMIAALRDEESRPGEIAEKAFYQALYGDQGYGLPVAGKAGSLNKIKRDDLQSWHKSRYRAGDAVISIIGDMTRWREAAGLAFGDRFAARDVDNR